MSGKDDLTAQVKAAEALIDKLSTAIEAALASDDADHEALAVELKGHIDAYNASVAPATPAQ